MVWALRNVFMMLPDSAWEPGGRIDPAPKLQPFDAFRPGALSLVSPLRIEHAPYRAARTRRKGTEVA
jgi:hypothetical protein